MEWLSHIEHFLTNNPLVVGAWLLLLSAKKIFNFIESIFKLIGNIQNIRNLWIIGKRHSFKEYRVIFRPRFWTEFFPVSLKLNDDIVCELFTELLKVEIKASGSVSKRTLEALMKLTTDDIKLIKKAGSFEVNERVSRYAISELSGYQDPISGTHPESGWTGGGGIDSPFVETGGVSDDKALSLPEMNRLYQIGIIEAPEIRSVNEIISPQNTVSYSDAPHLSFRDWDANIRQIHKYQLFSFACGHTFYIATAPWQRFDQQTQRPTVYRLSHCAGVAFTELGIEILKLAKPEPDEEFLSLFLSRLRVVGFDQRFDLSAILSGQNRLDILKRFYETSLEIRREMDRQGFDIRRYQVEMN